MVGMLLWKTPEKGRREKVVTIGERSVLHTRFVCAEVLRGAKTPESVVRRRVLAAGKQLSRRGVGRIVLPEEFAYRQQLGKWEIYPVSTIPLRQALTADWVRWSLDVRGVHPAGAKVAVCTQALTGEVVRAVTELSLRHRYVLLDLPHGSGEELSRRLRREYGVSLLLGPSEEQLRDAEALVLFAPREGCSHPGCIVVYDESMSLPPLSLPPALEKMLPVGVDRGALLSALWEAGAVSPGQIVVNGRFAPT